MKNIWNTIYHSKRYKFVSASSSSQFETSFDLISVENELNWQERRRV